MRCRFFWSVVMVVIFSGCGGAVDTGPAPAGGYNTTKVKYEEDPLAHVSKTDIEVGEFDLTEDVKPSRLEKVLSARNTEVLKFRGQIRGRPKIVGTHFVYVECTREYDIGTVTTSSGAGRFQFQDDLAIFEISIRSPQESGRHRVTISMRRALRDDGTMLPEDEPNLTVIAEGEIEVRADDQKPVPTPDPNPPKQ